MSELPHRWSTYARLQTQLARSQGSDKRTSRIDDRTWGIEAALNQLLAEQPPAEEELDRAIRSASRRERYRKRLRRIHLPAEEPAGTSVEEDTFDARERLRRVAGRVTPEDSALLRAVGEGYEYKEIAASTKVAAGTLRARVLRLRRTLSGRAGLPTLVATA